METTAANTPPSTNNSRSSKPRNRKPQTLSSQANNRQVTIRSGVWVKGGSVENQNQHLRPSNKAAAPVVDEIDEEYKVFVTGYTRYTQPHDIIEAFSKFGEVSIEKNNTRSAILVFKEKENAYKAIEASKQIEVYGELLTVEPFTGQLYDNKARMVRKYKEKCNNIHPSQIDWSGDFVQQVDRLLSAVRLTEEQVKKLETLYADLEETLRIQWPECVAVPFGSVPTGLGGRASDADCFARVRQAERALAVPRARRVLQRRPDLFAQLVAVPRAHTPIVKLLHLPTQTYCDVTFKTSLGAQNSELIKFLLHLHPRLIPLAVIIKYWAKTHELTGTGRLTNYALIMMLIFYLQQEPLKAIPSIFELQKDVPVIETDYWNTAFDSRPRPAPSLPPLSTLLGGFFEYYAKFDFDTSFVCPFLGRVLPRDIFEKKDALPPEFSRYEYNVEKEYVMPIRNTTAFVVQDPFELAHNVASCVSPRLSLDIRAYIKSASEAYENTKSDGCKDFLKTILFQKPKLTRKKNKPKYSVNLFSTMLCNFNNPNWNTIVREVAMTIFEKILKIKLVQIDETEPQYMSREKEKYAGTLTSAIWRKRHFPNISKDTKLDFEQKETRITEEILKVDKNNYNVNFFFMIAYKLDEKNAVVTIKLSEGNVLVFKDFGNFFVTVIQYWFRRLLAPHSKAAQNNTVDIKTKSSRKPEDSHPNDRNDIKAEASCESANKEVGESIERTEKSCD